MTAKKRTALMNRANLGCDRDDEETCNDRALPEEEACAACRAGRALRRYYEGQPGFHRYLFDRQEQRWREEKR